MTSKKKENNYILYFNSNCYNQSASIFDMYIDINERVDVNQEHLTFDAIEMKINIFKFSADYFSLTKHVMTKITRNTYKKTFDFE